MDNISKTFNLKNGKKYIIELNDIFEYEKKKEIMINLIAGSFMGSYFLIIVNCVFMTKHSHLSLSQIFFGLATAIMFIFFIVLCVQMDKNSNDIVDDYINYFKDDFNNIDFSEPISIDENYNILYFNKNKELHIFQIVYDNILYVAYNNEIKLEGKYIDKKNYNITLYVPIEKSFDYINNFKKNEV